MSKKSSLRHAIGAIAPSKPLVLPKDQTFTAPTSVIKHESAAKNISEDKKNTSDENGAQGEEVTNSPDTTITNPEGEQTTQDQKGTADQIGIQGEKLTHPTDTNVPDSVNEEISQDQESTSDQIKTQGEKLTSPEDTNGANLVGKNITQDEDSISDGNGTSDEKGTHPIAEPRLTREEKTARTLENLRKGFTRVPNSILMEIVYGSLSKAEIKILLLIARYTISFEERETAALSKADIERYTNLQGKSILESLASLEEKKLIIKIKGDQYTSNQLGLRYETESTKPIPPGGEPKAQKSTDVNGNTKRDKNLPQDQKSTHPAGEKGTCPTDEKSTYFKESSSNDFSKESLSCEIKFPDDMTARWKAFEKLKKFSHSKKEREIFQEMFIAYKKEFFDYCGKVVQFLEIHGNGKPGDEGKIHSPMVWIQNHWEANLKRYQTWVIQEQTLKEAQEKRESQEKELEQAQIQEKHEREKLEIKDSVDSERLLSIYPSDDELQAFVERAVRLSGCEFTLNSWRKQGWNSPVVKSCAISYFLESENESLKTLTSDPSARATA